jgi:hypothetical protein
MYDYIIKIYNSFSLLSVSDVQCKNFKLIINYLNSNALHRVDVGNGTGDKGG